MQLYYQQKRKRMQTGSLLIQTLVFSAAAVMIIGGMVEYMGVVYKSGKAAEKKELAFQIAEAGIEYYRWHLAHSKNDFTDGGQTSSPYVHQYYDKDSNNVGKFSLTVTPPSNGGTLVTIKSLGEAYGVGPSEILAKRAIEAKLVIPSLVTYAVITNDTMWAAPGITIDGPVRSNDGIRMDGLAKNIVSSAKATYRDPDDSAGVDEYAVHTHISPVDPYPPLTLSTREDVFQAGRQTSVSVFDFSALTSDMDALKTQANLNGKYLGTAGGSGTYGYHITLKTNGTYDLSTVTKQKAGSRTSCPTNTGQSGWGTWSIDTESTPVNYPIPGNGIIFAEDNVWVDGQIDGVKLTIVAARLPEAPGQFRNIIVNKNLLYTNYDGRDAIGLIAQGDLTIGLDAADVLRIDAAAVAQHGRIGRYQYKTTCSSAVNRTSITMNGMLATYNKSSFIYPDGTGYQTRNMIYDANLLYNPPPFFPSTGSDYQVLSWKEVVN